jgi:excisionase family DNA binding protein
MDLSLEQAAQILGKTRRQLVYMIEQGKLAAKKSGGRWVIERAALAADENAAQRTAQQQARFKAVVEEALIPGQPRRYSLRDLKAVQIAAPVYHLLAGSGSGLEKAAAHMRLCLDQLALGCHRYDRGEKTAAYRSARDAASLAAVELMLCATAGNSPIPLESILEKIEQELMPALAGLLRRSERGRS